MDIVPIAENGPRVLFVDDEPSVLHAMQRNLRKMYTVETATGGDEAIEAIRKKEYAVIVSDMRMPGMSGVELLRTVRVIAPRPVRLMLTGNADQQTAIDAVNEGAVFRFLNKPCDLDVLVPAIDAAVALYKAEQVERDLLEGTLTHSVKAMAEVLGMVAPEALGRGLKLRDSMRALALHFRTGPLWQLEIAALLSPIGHASVPPSILRKLYNCDELTGDEQSILDKVPWIGFELLNSVPRLENVAEIIKYQAKNYDGTGFPVDDLEGDQIPIGARMLRILNDRAKLEGEGVAKKRALDAMLARDGAYDLELLRGSFECMPDFLVNALRSDREVKEITVGQIMPGHVAVSDIVTTSGLLLVSAGSKISSMMLKRLQNYAKLGMVKQPVMMQSPMPASKAAL
jgi:response regulator RpfG family c-di-GMP phosphodiesterase